MKFGALMSATFVLYRQNFALFVGIIAVLAIPQAIINLILTLVSSSAQSMLTTSGSSPPTFHFWAFATVITTNLANEIVTFIFSTLITGALARAISARYLGQRISVTEAYTLVGAGTFVVLGIAAILSGIAVAIGLALLIIPGILLAVSWSFIPQAVVLEHAGITGSFSRSIQLVAGSWWRVFGIVLVLFLLVAIPTGIVGGVAGFLFGLLGTMPGRVLGSIAGAVAGVLVRPIEYSGLTLLYYDLRIQKEGLDIQNAANNLGGQPGV